jgi:aminomethyltransferase
MFAVSKRRREVQGHYRGAARVVSQLAASSSASGWLQGAAGRAGARGAAIADADGNVIGKVTSGGPSPSLGGAVGMGYVPPAFATPGTPLQVIVRERAQPAEVVPMPFAPHRYFRKPAAASGA